MEKKRVGRERLKGRGRGEEHFFGGRELRKRKNNNTTLPPRSERSRILSLQQRSGKTAADEPGAL